MRQHKRTQRKSHGGLLALVVLVVVFAGVAFLIASPSGPHTSAPDEHHLNRGEDAFYGSIANVPFNGQSTGVVKADTNCKPVENGLTNCIAIINATDSTELDFNYSHDMSKQACLAKGDNVVISLLSSGTVKVLRR